MPAIQSLTRCFRAAPIFLTLVPILVGCGSSNTHGSAPAITMQPAAATAPVGSAASYTVQATGDATLLYQWRLNGTAIAGATSNSYTTPSLTAQDATDSFSVVVSNSLGSVTSISAALNLGPRSPKPGDFRFKLVDLTLPALSVATNILSTSAYTSGPATLGTPLEVGSAGVCALAPSPCAWNFAVYTAPATITQTGALYTSAALSNMSGDLKKNASPTALITAIDEQPANGVYAVSYLLVAAGSNQPGGFIQTLNSASLTSLQSASTQEGQQSRVITGISYNSTTGLADYASFAWQSDTTTVFETRTIISTYASVEADAATLAQAGYIITATGSGPSNGFLLVGTRVQGDSLPRPFSSVSYPNSALGGVAAVALIFDANGNSYLAEK